MSNRVSSHSVEFIKSSLFKIILFETSVKRKNRGWPWVGISTVGLYLDWNSLLILLEGRRRFSCGDAAGLRTIAIDYHCVLFILFYRIFIPTVIHKTRHLFRDLLDNIESEYKSKSIERIHKIKLGKQQMILV
jgi:hypothetical protein